MRVTKSEIASAKQYDVLSYLQRADPYELVKVSGNEYRLRSHDSFRISNGLWHWFSRGRGGRSAVDYLIHVKGYSFPNAVIEVNKVMRGDVPSCFAPRKEAFKLPAKNINYDVVIRYLMRRGIDFGLINLLMSEGLLYEDREHHSAIFVGKDDDGNPAYAAYRTTDNSGRRGDAKGSNKKYSFRFGGGNSEVLHVFEGAIDLLSFITIRIRNEEDFGNDSYLSLGGVSKNVHRIPSPLEHYLKHNPNTEMIVLHLDNDEVGRACSSRLKELLEPRYQVKVTFPEHGKDVNDSLLAMRMTK